MKQRDFNSDRKGLSIKDRYEIHELLSKRLGDKKKRLLKVRLAYDIKNIPYHGILSRIQHDEKTGWSYCAGQSYVDEIRTIRDIILNLR